MTYEQIERLARELGAKQYAINKWRQRGIPRAWQIALREYALNRGYDIEQADFTRGEK